MRATNRGDVPKPHVPPGQGQTTATADTGEDVVFDAGSLSFVKDWVVDGGGSGGAGAAAAVDVEPARDDPRQSNPNRRLGVGARPKKSKQERPEPSALEKKLLRKRHRQEFSDAIAGEVDSHGVVMDGKDGDVESKTASFKKKIIKRDEHLEPDAAAPAPPASAAEEKKPKKSKQSKKSKKDKEGGADVAVNGGGGETAIGEKGGEGDGDGEKQGRKRKARRKKNKSAAAEVVAEGGEADGNDVAEEVAPQKSTTAVDQQQHASVVAQVAVTKQGDEKKQRRGWGKARSKPAAAPSPAEGTTQTTDAVEEGRERPERRPRKKTRSRQKNIRKDKRPSEKRPSYLRAGDPEYSGRGLTDETRKFLGLPADGFGEAPPAGWGKPGKVPAKPVFLIDKKPRQLPKHLAPGEVGDGDGVEADEDAGVALNPTGQSAASTAAGSKSCSAAKSKSTSKYKNLTLPVGAAKVSGEKNKGKKGKRSRSSSDAAVV